MWISRTERDFLMESIRVIEIDNNETLLYWKKKNDIHCWINRDVWTGDIRIFPLSFLLATYWNGEAQNFHNISSQCNSRVKAATPLSEPERQLLVPYSTKANAFRGLHGSFFPIHRRHLLLMNMVQGSCLSGSDSDVVQKLTISFVRFNVVKQRDSARKENITVKVRLIRPLFYRELVLGCFFYGPNWILCLDFRILHAQIVNVMERKIS